MYNSICSRSVLSKPQHGLIVDANHALICQYYSKGRQMKQYLDKHGIKDGLLREFVIREKWSAAMQAAWDAIGKREKEVEALKGLVKLLEEKR
jgi:hypothetical protein